MQCRTDVPADILTIYNCLAAVLQNCVQDALDSEYCSICGGLTGFQCPTCNLWFHEQCFEELAKLTTCNVNSESDETLGADLRSHVALAGAYRSISEDWTGEKVRSILNFQSGVHLNPCKGEINVQDSLCQACRAVLEVVQDDSQAVFAPKPA